VISPSFNGLYFRNAFNVGLLLLTCPDAEQVEEGEHIAFDARACCVYRAAGQCVPTEPIPLFLLEMVEAGGLLAQLQKRSKTRNLS
jgi:3-isopropylmalate/(R)-2-methylmalate dehydratase small subunit